MMPIGDTRDGFFYPILTLMIYSYIVKGKNALSLKLSMQFFPLAYKHLIIIDLISPGVRKILNNISCVKCHFVVLIPIGYVYNKVKQIQFDNCLK